MPEKITSLKTRPRIIPRDQHNVSREQISESALKVLYRLKNAGYQACLVGGAVRDILLGIQPKDFDVVTDAHPEQIRELFRNCRLIGRRFRLAHVRFGADEIIEVSTFRKGHQESAEGQQSEQGRIIRDNVYGTIDDDVWRRDFTVNALFYNIEDFSIIDYVAGLRDIENRTLRFIGDPVQRYREDPVRMLRAIRFSAKLEFTIAEDAARPISKMAALLDDIPAARLYEEFLKLFMSGHAVQSWELLQQHGLAERLFPEAYRHFQAHEQASALFKRALANTDNRVRAGQSVTPAFIVSAMLWGQIDEQADQYRGNGLSEYESIQLASDAVVSRVIKSVSIPRRVTMIAREIWLMQSRLRNTRGKRPLRLLSHQRFRAGFDFLELRSITETHLKELVDFWQDLQKQHPEKLFNRAERKTSANRARTNHRKRRHRSRDNQAK